MADAVSRRPLTNEVGLIQRPVCIGFVVDELVRTEDLVRVRRFLPVSTIQPVLHALLYTTDALLTIDSTLKVTHPATHPYADPY